MDQAHLIKILMDLGVKNMRHHPHTGHVQVSCLLAPWRHEHGKDSSPSCSISFKHEVSLAHCFTGGCEFGGTFHQYISLYNQYKNGEVSEIVDAVRFLERGDPSVKIDVI